VLHAIGFIEEPTRAGGLNGCEVFRSQEREAVFIREDAGALKPLGPDFIRAGLSSAVKDGREARKGFLRARGVRHQLIRSEAAAALLEHGMLQRGGFIMGKGVLITRAGGVLLLHCRLGISATRPELRQQAAERRRAHSILHSQGGL